MRNQARVQNNGMQSRNGADSMTDGTRIRPTTFASGPRAARRAVQRAVAELRRGDPVLMRPDRGPALLIQAAETATADSAAALRALSGRPIVLLLTGQRAVSLGLWTDSTGVVALDVDTAMDPAIISALADPTATPADAPLPRPSVDRLSGDLVEGALATCRLLKLAHLIPAALATPVERPFPAEQLVAHADLLSVSAGDIARQDDAEAATLRPVAEARVPLSDSERTRIVAFRPTDGGREHLAIILGDPAPAEPALIRIHSECFTGDLLGSLRCDCGDQLRGAIGEISRHGSGVLLYLAQEGRGIGLVNKLRAYRLQDAAFDTVDANEMLGYEADERVYRPAAAMLRQLGYTQVRLMTNNPEKVAQLEACGVAVVERVPHVFPANGHNEFYLRTKKERSGHLI